LRPLLLATLLLAALAAPVSAEEAAAIDIVRNPSAYQDRFLTVRGTMMNLRPAAGGGMAIPAATFFDLMSGPAILGVLSPVPPACPIGSTVTVEGRFLLTAYIRQQLYTNVIDASLVSCR
jgi:hypothetical protein